MSKSALWAGVLGGLGAAALGYALKVEPLQIEVTETALSPGRLPERLDGLPVLFLADPHVWERGPRERRMLDLLDALPTPELIVWGGDFIGSVEGVVDALWLVEEVARRFSGVPTLAVPGNAEHKLGMDRRERLYHGLAEAGVRLLVNEWIELTLRGETISVVGVDDAYYGWADLERAFEGVPADRFTLLLSHSPQIAALVADRADLMLSGHTHGGQVRIPGYGAVKTQNPLSRKLDCGVFDRERLAEILGRDPEGDLLTFVGRGIGVATLPHVPWFAPRFHCRPEVACLTLRAASSDLRPE